MLGAGAQFRARLLEDLGAGFQRCAQFLRGSHQIRAMENNGTTPMSFREEPFSAPVI